jgi:signal peptidase II
MDEIMDKTTEGDKVTINDETPVNDEVTVIVIKSKKYYKPFILTALIIIVDQVSKAFISIKWPSYGVIKDIFNNGFLLIYHVRNKAVAFSLGDNSPEGPFRQLLVVVAPLFVLAFLVWYYFKSDDFSRLQRWAIAGIIGGGLGNIIDRVFRRDGVVDFISVKLYGLFGMERWPTFNAADSSVVVCCLLLLATMIKPEKENLNE